MTGPGPGALSLFGETYEPADPPASDRCPACSGPIPARTLPPCQPCRARSIEAPRLDLAPAALEPAPTMTLADYTRWQD